MLYFRPFYVESSRNPFPKLDYFIVVYSGPTGQSQVAFDTTLPLALQDLFSVSLPTPGSASAARPTGPATVSQHVQSLIAQANTDFQQAQTDLKSGNFAAYGTDITTLQGVLQQLQQATASSKASSSKTSAPKATSSTSTHHQFHPAPTAWRCGSHRGHTEPVAGEPGGRSGANLTTTTRGGAVW